MRETHPAADVFPMMPADAIRSLADDIKANGLMRPGIILDGRILDGRNRAAACELAGVEMRWEEYSGDDPIGFVVSMNLQRRDLTPDARALAAQRLVKLAAKLTKASKKHDRQQPRLPAVAVETAEMAAKVEQDGTPELVQAVEQGDVPMSAAAIIADLEPDQQRQALERIAKHSEVKPQRAKQPEQVMSVARRIEPVELVALKAGLVVLERSAHAEVRHAAKVVRSMVPALGGG